MSSEERDKTLYKFKVVETSLVTDEVLEELINEWTARGWHLEDIRFVTKESSRRPVMAFLFFTRPAEPEDSPPSSKEIV